MHVLNDLGRHQEAIAAGQDTLEIVEAPGMDAPMIAALAHMNLGVCFETLGRYDEALTAYDRAEARFTEAGMEDRLGDVFNNRGIVLAHLGRNREALAAFEQALAAWEADDLALLQAQTLSNIGEAYLALGHFTRSLNAFERARGLFENLDALAERSILIRKTADAYLALNLLPEALRAYREAVESLELAGMADQRGRALWGLGAALAEQEDYGSAADCLAQAAELFESAGNIPMQASVAIEQADLLQRRGDLSGALAAAQSD
jgi:tetratricopeptide (TPR) repeat protein